MCCLDISPKAFYLFINFLDLLLIISAISNEFTFEKTLKLKVINIVFLLNFILFFIFTFSLIYFFKKKSFDSSLHRNYARIRLLYIFIDIYSSIKILLIYFGVIKEHMSRTRKNHLKGNIFAASFLLLILSWNIYLSYQFFKIIFNNSKSEKKEDLVEKNDDDLKNSKKSIKSEKKSESIVNN